MNILTDDQFAALDPIDRGFLVYMYGANSEQPCIPDEANPYPAKSENATEWARGQQLAVRSAQDSP